LVVLDKNTSYEFSSGGMNGGNVISVSFSFTTGNY